MDARRVRLETGRQMMFCPKGHSYPIKKSDIKLVCSICVQERLFKRFSEKIVFGEGSSCSLWIGALTKAGYGLFRLSTALAVYAHRFAWELQNGPITNGLHVCHKCDVPNCVRVDHLFLGTAKDNMVDKENKGRGTKGKKQPKLQGDNCWMRRFPERVPRGAAYWTPKRLAYKERRKAASEEKRKIKETLRYKRL